MNTSSRTPIDFGLWLGLVIQVCRLKIQRERDAMDYRDKMAKARGAVDRSNQRINEMLDRVIAKENDVHKATDDVEQAHHGKLNGQIKDMETMLHDLAEFSNGGPALEEEPTPTPMPGVRGYPL